MVLTAAGEERLITPVQVDALDPVRSLARECVRAGLRVQWRHVLFANRPLPDPERWRQGRLPRWEERERRGGEEGQAWRKWPTCLPTMPGTVPRWVSASTWTPPQSLILSRHREQFGQRRVVTTSRIPPRGFELEYDLGCARVFSLEGTKRLLALEDGSYATLPPGDWDAAPPDRGTSAMSRPSDSSGWSR